MIHFILGGLAAMVVFFLIAVSVQLVKIEKMISDVAILAEAKVAKLFKEG
ncbi:MAG: hypothetical protein GF398_18510 [Chitinivibrionales bacterium]|nr:hypothetical protein [Chitinivibrionales bacterium]